MDEEFINWEDSYSVNFAAIDNQHKELVNMTNELILDCKIGRTTIDAALMNAIKGALAYTQTHFYDEEQYMKKAGYPDLLEHQIEHKAFIAEIVKFFYQFEENNASPIELARFLKKWLMNHIAVTDQKFAPYMKNLQE